MDPTEAEQIARLLEQLHEGVAFLVNALTGDSTRTVAQVAADSQARNPLGGMVFSFAAVAIIYSYDCVAQPLGWPQALLDLVNPVGLGVTQNNQANGETPQRACLRHLRNVFAHGRYRTEVQLPDVVRVRLTDVNERGNVTFQAECEAPVVVELAERLLIESHRLAAAQALPLPVPQGGHPAA